VVQPVVPPEPPYVAVIFTSVRNTDDPEGYTATAERMVQLAAQQPGYLGVESVRDPETRLGITVSYWRTEDDARAWKEVAEHLDAQHTGRSRWYERYSVHIATVTRGYTYDRLEDERDSSVVAERMASPGEGTPIEDVRAEIRGDG
jgi:heme-degrading monooxygenase HmoA